MTALETVESHDTSPKLTREFGFEVYEEEELEGLVSREQLAPSASVCYRSKTQQALLLLRRQWQRQRC